MVKTFRNEFCREISARYNGISNVVGLIYLGKEIDDESEGSTSDEVGCGGDGAELERR